MTIQRSTTTTTLTLTGTLTVGELMAHLDGLPSSATIRVQHHAGDQRDPAYTTMTITHPTGSAR
jgi:hypothetical protein